VRKIRTVSAGRGLAAVGVSVALWALFPWTFATASAGPTSLDALLSEWAVSPGFRASLTEERHLALLRAPLISSGVLAFIPPDRFVRRIAAPVPSLLVIDGTTLRYEGDGERGSVDLAGNPLFRVLVAGARKLFSGESDALKEAFDVTWMVEGAPGAGWEIGLRPRQAGLREHVTRIVLSGRGTTLERLQIVEASGDETRMQLRDVEMQHAFEAEEIKVLLGTATQSENS